MEYDFQYNVAPPLGDPWGGSYLMEALTDQVYESALNIINEVQARGTVLSSDVEMYSK